MEECIYIYLHLKRKGILKNNRILEYVYSYCMSATTDISGATGEVKHC